MEILKLLVYVLCILLLACGPGGFCEGLYRNQN